jgi:N-glycosylase/DNA lyase
MRESQAIGRGEVAAPGFSLQASLASGQAFRWRQRDGGYEGVLGRAVVTVRQDGARLFWSSSDPAVTGETIRRYFALDLPLADILSSIDVDMQVHRAIERHPGLRVLRQDGWEALASFILASFNNIARIEGMIERLCRAYGEPLRVNGITRWTFPQPDAIARASERALRGLGLGYRAPYLRATARRVADGRLVPAQLRGLAYPEAKAALLACDGVGEKVADCAALFGCEQYQAFPIDVWIERAMRYYCRHRRLSRRQLQAYAQRHFGPYAGYAQQYLYHDIRSAHSRQHTADSRRASLCAVC